MSLILKNVSYSYDEGTPFEKKALENINLTVENGQFVGLAGPTGSGKSTLLRLIKGLSKPTSGTIENTDNSKIGLVFQYPENQLFEETVLKDVMFGPLNTGYTQKDAESLSIDALNSLGLDSSFYDRSPLDLSGGEKRRVAIAGILSMNVDVLLLDEPSAGLDKAGCESLFSLLEKLNSKGKTIVIVSHDINQINRYCSRAVVLKEGIISESGKPSDLDYCKSYKSRLLSILREMQLI